MQERLKTLAGTLAVTLIVAALTFAGGALLLRPSHLQFRLTAGSGFSITSTISGSGTTRTPASLYPGTQRYLWYDIANPLTVPLTVQSLSITAVTPPAGCAASNLDTSATTFSGNLAVPAFSGGVSGTAAVAVPISLKDLPLSQNDPSSSTENCAGKTFIFTFGGSAVYTDATTVNLTSSPNPSAPGSPVTFTATVLAANAGADPSQPSGSVSFYTCSTSACTTQTALGTGSMGAGGQATLVTTGLPLGSNFVQASYPGSSTNFGASVSNVVTQTVIYGTTTTLTSTPNPSQVGQGVALTAKVTKLSGSATPTGTVSFFLGTPTGTHTLLGNASLNAGGVANMVISTLPQGTDSLYAAYPGTSTFASSRSPVITQSVLSAIPTSVTLTSSPNPSLIGQSVLLTAQVTKSSGTAAPTGTVSFFLGTPTGTSHTLLGTSALTSAGTATLATSSLPAGVDSLYAVYSGTATYATSTTGMITQTVTGLPSHCAPGLYQNFIIGSPVTPVISGTNQNDFIYAPGSVGYLIHGGQGSDCILGGNGSNTIIDGNGNGDGKSRDDVVVGNGTNLITVGNGTDSLTVGSGSGNVISIGNGNDTVTLGGGNRNSITSGNGSSTIFLGAGTFNTFIGGRNTNTCHLPKTPTGAPGTAAFYHDTIVNCTVVSP